MDAEVIIAIILVCIGMMFGVAIGLSGGQRDGYELAYQHLKEGKLETVMQTKHADVWVKYNILNKEKTEPK